jgi:hypothetical protein
MRTFLLTLAFGLVAGAAYAGEGCTNPACRDPAVCDPACNVGCGGCQQAVDPKSCPRCGCKMTCKVVRTEKEIKKTVFTVKCEPLCLPCPRPRLNCCLACGDRDCDGGCTAEQPGCCDGGCAKCCDPCAVEKCKPHVPPKCGPVRCKKTLVCEDKTCKVPSYKCIPVCCNCGYGDPCAKAACDPGCGAVGPMIEQPAQPQPKVAPAPAPELPPAPAPKTTQAAPMPPILGASYRR